MQLEVGWLPVVTHVTEIVQLLSLDVQSQEMILSLIDCTEGKTKVPLQPAAYSTTKKTINPMLLMAQTHSVNTVIKPILNAALNPAQHLYHPVMVIRNET